MTSGQRFLVSVARLAKLRHRPLIARLTRNLSVALILSICAVLRPLAAQSPKDVLTVDIDSTVSPRDDFFQFANGGWFKRNPIPENQARWSPENLEDLYPRLRQISEEAAATRARRGSVEQLVGDFWYTGMDSATTNRLGLSVLRPDLERIDRIRSIGDVIDVVAMLHRRDMLLDGPVGYVGWLTLFSAQVMPDEANSRRRIFTLEQGGNTVGPLVYTATDARRTKIRDAFREYLFATFRRLSRDTLHAKADASAVFELEASMARAVGPRVASPKIGFAELQKLTPAIDWNRYFRDLHAAAPDSVSMLSPRFFQTVDSLLRVTPIETWRGYLQFCLVRAHAPFLDDGTFGEFFAFNRARTGVPQPKPRWMRVVWEEKNWFGQPFGQLIAQRYPDKNGTARSQRLGESLRAAFRTRISQLEWMSDSTKQNAQRKLAALRITIGWPERWLDVSTMPIRRDSWALNMARSAEWYHDWEMKQLPLPITTPDIDPQYNVGGDWGYDEHTNEVQIPTVFGDGSAALDDAFLYGSTALGHEISHAFDSVGRYYDAQGNKMDWWTPADTLAFNARAQALIDEYSAFSPLEGVKVNGRGSLRENMADVVGLRVQLDAFKKTEQYKRNVRIAGFTPLQRFFLAYAHSRLVAERPEYIRATSAGAYAPMRERVNGSLMNMSEFYEAFGVGPGDRMFLPESARARIW